MIDQRQQSPVSVDGVAPPATPRRSSQSWRLFALLVGASAIGAAAVVPYAMASLPTPPVAPPLALVVLAAMAQTAVLAAIAAACGIWLGPRAGLGPPLIRQRLSRGAIAWPIVGGLAVGVVLLALDALVFGPLLPRDLAADSAQRVAPWMGLLASVYGAVDEEVLLRFGVMSFLAWLMWRLSRRPDKLADGLMWAAIIVATLVFGAGHLPATAALVPLTPIVIARALLLNGLAGVLYGWVYWRQGLALAMLAHGATDLVLHVLAPLLVGRA